MQEFIKDKYDSYARFGISGELIDRAEAVEASLADAYARASAIAEVNQLRVVEAFREAHVGEANLLGTTGYGYDDLGRSGLEQCYAAVFGTEAALVRPQVTCGTHALAVALFGNLRPGDELIYASGSPYDTLEEVIGIRPSPGSLAEYGVTYKEVPLKDGGLDLPAIRAAITDRTRIVALQRSKGYQSRRTLTIAELGEAIRAIHQVRSDILVMVDNCYGEFTETLEPSHVGADMVVGSLIKNPGGGLAPTGGYIAGTAECIQRAFYRLTAPGLGGEVGATLGILPSLYQGLFIAPSVVASAMKTALFCAALFADLGCRVIPEMSEERSDIIQCVELGSEEAMIAFCQGIQSVSPVDSFARPLPDAMPGYEDRVIMAAGAFVSGSTMELSADGPVRPPYAVFLQGALTQAHGRLGVLAAAQNMLDRGLLTL